MADEDGSSDDIERPYGSMRIHPTIQITTQQAATKAVVKPPGTVSTAPKTRKSKYGPPSEIRLKKKNQCIIFSNRFENIPKWELPQNKIDEENIERTFSWLNFEVETHINKDTNETDELIKELCGNDYSDKECLVCFFITHGDKDKKLYANNRVKFSLDDDVIQKLVNCQSLHSKPKLLFVQACRGRKPMEAVEESDGSDLIRANIKKKKAKDADTFVYFSTTEGYLAWGNIQVGSHFIDTLCGVLQEYGGEYHLGDVVTKVNEVLAERVSQNKGLACDVVEVGDVHHTLTSKLYFNPQGPFPEVVEEKERSNVVKSSINVGSGRTVVKITNRK